MKLYTWREAGEKTHAGHWSVYYDFRSRRELQVLLPFNFFVSAYFIWKRMQCRVEDWMVRLASEDERS